uniref:Saposin B-type domain-containing protein n=1 Tax=Parastrongyloides trichosuri TaxID=131310 RepID=A0A0N5A425_PARTI
MKVFSIVLVVLISLATLTHGESKGLFCSACNFLWNEVKKEMPVVANDGGVALKKEVTKVCDKFNKSIPLLGQICEQVSTDVIDDVYQFILTEDNKINPEKICEHLKMC